ncbi:thioesterase family protein [Neptuniibacter halophilus]|uniref:thioesterase family protein n=1 Tax=Neptuniibacter halophilus TaxID=651666 RepID=UPI0025731A9F|nr:thioesterase family protein [Neptuniibacter halophilus]
MTQRPEVVFSTNIQPEWLDYNDHMNVAYYVLIFDKAGEALVSELGLSEAVTRETQISWMVLENHITYNNEVVLDQPVEVRAQLLDHDAKRMHLYFEMFARDDKGGEYLASTLEQMAMCVDLSQRKSCPFPEAVSAKLAQMSEAQSSLEKPSNIGRTIGIRRK